MVDSSLRSLARVMGLALDWLDITGQSHQVSADSLKEILRAMGIEAGTPRKAAAALKAHLATKASPALLTCQRGSFVPLLAGTRRQQVEILLEGEDKCRQLDILTTPLGRGFRAPRRLGYHCVYIGQQEYPLAVAPRRALTIPEMTKGKRSWGLSAQVYSLRHALDDGVGDYSALAELSTSAARAGAAALAISPLHAQFSADRSRFSPYSPSNRLWLNILHIDVSAAEQLLFSTIPPAPHKKTPPNGRGDYVDWPKVHDRKLVELRRLFAAAQRSGLIQGIGPLGSAYIAFKQHGGQSLYQHALFEAIHSDQFRQSSRRWSWQSWSPGLRNPESKDCAKFAASHMAEIDFHIFLQWLAEQQLAAAANACRRSEMSIGLIADIAIGVDYNGSEVWSRSEDMLPGLSIGAPPDDFNNLGQNWGITTFSPMGLATHGYRAFIALLRQSMRHAGGVRLDHVLGLSRLWVIPPGAAAVDGVYLTYPLQDLLRLAALESHRAASFILGEDLGTVPAGFRDTLQEAGIHTMQVLWFQRDTQGGFIPARDWSVQSVGMTTTHDLPTVAGWWRGTDLGWRRRLGLLTDTDVRRQRRQDKAALLKLIPEVDASTATVAEVVNATTNLLGKTACDLVLLPLEDALGIEQQPNLPGTIDQHPNWRRRLNRPVRTILQTKVVASRLRSLAKQRPNK